MYAVTVGASGLVSEPRTARVITPILVTHPSPQAGIG